MISPYLFSGCVIHQQLERGPFRQILFAPVRRIDDGKAIHLSDDHLPCILIERRNGQIICLRLLSVTDGVLDIGSFFEILARCLPRDIRSIGNSQRVEIRISQATGHSVVFREVALVTAALLCRSVGSDPYPTEFEEVLAGFIRRLDPQVLEALTITHRPLTPESYNRYYSVGPAFRQRRLQVVRAIPLLEPLLMSKERSSAAIRRAVDSAVELLPVLCKSLNISRELARWLVGKTLDQIGLTWQGRIRDLTCRMACLSPARRPVTLEEWQACNEFIDAIDAMYSDDTYQTDSPNALLLREVARLGWLEAKRKLNAIGLTPASLIDLADVIEELTEALIDDIGGESILSELLGSDPKFALAVRRKFHSIGLMRQIRTSLRWHQLQQDECVRLHQNPDSALYSTSAWTPAFDGCIDLGDKLAYCISDVAQLREEGRLLQHCVGSYAERCLYDGSTIVSLRHLSGQRLSTAELVLYMGPEQGLLYRLRQHKGIKNSSPTEPLNHALEQIVLGLNGDQYRERRMQLFKETKLRAQFRLRQIHQGIGQARFLHLQQALTLHIGYENFRRCEIS